MSAEAEIQTVLSHYPAECRPFRVEALGCAGGFSGARFWRLHTAAGRLCLRRWPEESPTLEQLQFIQAVLWHVTREGFDRVPLPRETLSHAGYVDHDGHLWELSPWLPGKANFRERPTVPRLQAALEALAEFHQAAETFPIPDPQPAPSPGIRSRLEQLRKWVAGDLALLNRSVTRGVWPEVETRSARILERVPLAAGSVLTILSRACRAAVPLQVCIGDIWHDHVLYLGDRVAGFVDFGSMRTDSPTTDLARLLGSMAGDNPDFWRQALEVYESLRPLSPSERLLLNAFDQSTVLMAGLNWIDWIFRQHRTFEVPDAIPKRLDDILVRLEKLCDTAQPDWGGE